MLTALSVARECGLVGRQQQVISVKTIKNVDDGMKPMVTFETTGSPKVRKSQNRRIYLSICSLAGTKEIFGRICGC